MSKRYARNRSKERYAPKVDKLEVSEKHFTLRLVLTIVFLLLGATTLATAFSRLVSKQSGWQEISVNSNDSVNCSGEFTFMYELGSSGGSAGTESRALSSIYTQACIDAYQYFNADEAGADFANLYDLNQNPNKKQTLSHALYEALQMVEEAESRYLYLGPIYAAQSNLMTADSDVVAEIYDPYLDEDQRDFYQQVAAFAKDKDAISIKFYDDDSVELVVSQDYLDFAEKNGIETFVDFSYMKNAFVCDYIADTIIDEGYTAGCLTSYDGYVRYLGDESLSFSYSIYEREGSDVTTVASGNISGRKASITLKDYPVAEYEEYYYYTYEDGTIRSSYVSLDDGCDKASKDYVFLSSKSLSCAEILLSALPVYISDSFDGDAIQNIADVECSFSVDGEVISTIK